MKLNYHRDTDSLYIDLSEQVSVESRDVSEGVVLDYDASGNLVGIDIDNARAKVQMDHMVLSQMDAEMQTIAGWPNDSGGGSEFVSSCLCPEESTKHIAAARADASSARPAALEDPELFARVAHVVIALHDRGSVAALAGAMFLGTSISRELARWGDDGAVAVLNSMATPGMPSATVHDGLIALRMLAERADSVPLSVTTAARIQTLARANLAASARLDEYGVGLRRTIDLAIALGDADLRATVQSLATSAQEVRLRGIRSDRVAMIQTWAADRLRGVPALPRP